VKKIMKKELSSVFLDFKYSIKVSFLNMYLSYLSDNTISTILSMRMVEIDKGKKLH